MHWILFILCEVCYYSVLVHVMSTSSDTVGPASSLPFDLDIYVWCSTVTAVFVANAANTCSWISQLIALQTINSRIYLHKSKHHLFEHLKWWIHKMEIISRGKISSLTVQDDKSELNAFGLNFFNQGHVAHKWTSWASSIFLFTVYSISAVTITITTIII